MYEYNYFKLGKTFIFLLYSQKEKEQRWMSPLGKMIKGKILRREPTEVLKIM